MTSEAPSKYKPLSETKKLLQSLWHYPGERLLLDGGGSPLPWLVDLLVALQLLVLLLRNTLLDQHLVALPIALMLGAYLFLFTRRPPRLEYYRLLLLVLVCILSAIAIPMRTGQPATVGAFIACLGLLVLFFARGTKTTLAVASLYIAYVGWRAFTVGSLDNSVSYGLTVVLSLTSAVFIALLLQAHFMLRSENAVNALKATAQEARVAVSELQEFASIGGIGLYRIDLDSGNCEVNSVFRTLLELPEEQYPTVTLDHFASRFGGSGGSVLKQRVQGEQYDDLTLLTLQMPDGRKKEVKAMSRRIDYNGRRIRSGLVMAVASTA